MTRSFNTLVSAVALAVAGIASLPAHAADDAAAYDTYRAVVQGDTSVQRPVGDRVEQGAGTQVPGPYARKLIRDGRSQQDALREAALFGEQPTIVLPAVAKRELSGYEAYLRLQGHAIDDRADTTVGAATSATIVR